MRVADLLPLFTKDAGGSGFRVGGAPLEEQAQAFRLLADLLEEGLVNLDRVSLVQEVKHDEFLGGVLTIVFVEKI